MTDPIAQIAVFESQLTDCLRRDQHPLRRRLQQLRKRGASEQAAALAEVGRRIEASRALREARAQAVPALDYPDLPVSGRKDEIVAAVQAHQVVVVCGETGSGKTTQLPKICLEAGRGRTGYIGHTQPRRIAARTVAARIAEELKQPLGQAVGYKVRFQDQTRPESLIKLMTDGILLAETQADRFLDQYDTLIIDEAHERSLNIDFLLGYLRWLLPKRPDFKLIVTSATIDPDRFARHFGGAPIVEVSGRSYPVEVRYRPVTTDESDETDRGLQQAILDAADELYRERAGDLLIFLSGEREIRETTEALRKHHPPDAEILPLYSRLSVNEQQKVFEPHGRRRIVLATNVAETSLTVPGIRCVIDPGYVRLSRYSHRSKLQRLPIEKISQASANQRAGRCGRVAPGICIRLYDPEDFGVRPEFTDPEILRTNLAQVILQMQSLGLGELETFPFMDPPDPRLIRDGVRTLQEIHAVDDQRRLTAIGKQLAKLPVDPRLGRMLLAAHQESCLAEVAVIAAALSIPDPRERPLDRQQAADQQHAKYKDDKSDFLSLLKLWNDFEEQKKHLSNSKLRQYCRENFLSYVRLREWHDIHQQILLVLKGDFGFHINENPAAYPEIHIALLTGLLSQIGFLQEGGEYVGARGLKFQIHPGSGLFKKKPKWIVAAEQVETTKVYARIVAAVEPDWIERCGQHLLRRHHYDPHWERKPARAAVMERTTLFGLNIASGRRVPYENIDPKAAREIFIREALVHQDFDTRAEFFAHNRDLLAEADYLQQKGRRVDLIADEEWIFAFYDERIPEDVVSGQSFDNWRRRAEQKDPNLLKLTREMITRNDDRRLDARNFPDELVVGATKLRLEYRFEPGHPEDGVTVVVPLHQLNQLAPDPFEWLVPGLLRDKVIALIKSLPKNLRRHFVPAPDYADRCLPYLQIPRGSLVEALIQALAKQDSLSLSPRDFTETDADPHLRMNFRVVDEAGKTVASSRNLAELQGRHQGAAKAEFQQIAAARLAHSRCQDWTFGDLPRLYDASSNDRQIQGFPAIIDEGESVGVQVFDTEAEAARRHRQGLVRLLRIRLGKDLKYLKKNLPFNASHELTYKSLKPAPWVAEPTPADLREDTLDLIVAALYLDEQPEMRSKAALDERIWQHRAELNLSAGQIGKQIAETLAQVEVIRRSLASPLLGPIAKDVAAQLERLIYTGFLKAVPYGRIKEFPRYLKAVAYRLEKAPQDKARDEKLAAQLAPYWTRYWDSVAKARAAAEPETDPFRWMLEEFRVSLFAQSIKTPYPISAKRLDEAWTKREKA